eukprot:4321432-Prymnesium_polylepis.1
MTPADVSLGAVVRRASELYTRPPAAPHAAVSFTPFIRRAGGGAGGGAGTARPREEGIGQSQKAMADDGAAESQESL